MNVRYGAQKHSLGHFRAPRPQYSTDRVFPGTCKGARPNHVGVVIARHKRAGRIEERDGKLYARQSAGTEQRAAV